MTQCLVRRTLVFFAATWMAFAATSAIAQTSPTPVAAPPSAKNAPTTKPIVFDVASIRRNKTGIGGGSGLTDDGYVVRNMFPVVLLGSAYQVWDFKRILGLPDWCNFGNEGYDVNAKVAESDISEWRKQSPKDIQGALQALLQDRFQLKAHFETRDAPAFALVVAKNGPKFKVAVPGDTYPNGLHDGEGKPIIGMRFKDEGAGNQRLIAQSVPIAALSLYLSGFLNRAVGRPVVDKTGLTGTYDFTMPILAEWGTTHEVEETEASIFTTIQEALGLKLEPTKTPVEFLVIDHIERPSEN